MYKKALFAAPCLCRVGVYFKSFRPLDLQLGHSVLMNDRLVEVRRSSYEIVTQGAGEIFMIVPMKVLAFVFNLSPRVIDDFTDQLDDCEPDEYIRFGISDVTPFPGYYEIRYADEYPPL